MDGRWCRRNWVQGGDRLNLTRGRAHARAVLRHSDGLPLHSNRVTIAVAMALPHKRACTEAGCRQRKFPTAGDYISQIGADSGALSPAPTHAVQQRSGQALRKPMILVLYPDRRPRHVLIQHQGTGAREFQAGDQRAGYRHAMAQSVSGIGAVNLRQEGR